MIQTDVANIFSLIFALILLLLVTGRYHRSVAALLGALLTIVFGVEYGLFSIQNIWSELASFIDINAVLLVIGVMILVEAVARSGFFEFVGLTLARAVGGGFGRVSVAFIFLTILFSALLSNITAMIIMGALTVSLAKKFGANPSRTVLYEAIVTNVGGLTFMISSIPNLIVAAEMKIGFIEFAAISVPLALIISAVTMLFIAGKMSRESSTEQRIEVDPWSVVKSKKLFYRATIVFTCVIILFAVEDFTGIPVGLIAITGAIGMLVLGGQEPESIFSDVDWGTIIFITSFYVVVGGLQSSGVLTMFAEDVAEVLSFHPAVTSVLNIWICGLSSSVVDNIPMTLTLIPVAEHISSVAHFPLKSLGWGIVFGANLGGNLTPIGSPSNVIALGILKREGKSVDWREWFKAYVPLVMLQLLIASVYATFLSAML